MTAKPVIVLVRPQLGQNIGKAARAMLNFGLTEMRLVAPRDGWPNPDAGPAASGADIVLEQAQVFDTRRRKRSPIARTSTPRPCAGATWSCRSIGAREMADADRRVAGRDRDPVRAERSGLETEEVALANAIVTVPINPEFGSLNLAQAVILLAYEWSKRHASSPSRPAKELEPPAPHGEARRPDRASSTRSSIAKGYFHPPSRTQATQQHDPHDLHQDRLVVARGEGGARHHPGAGRAARERRAQLN